MITILKKHLVSAALWILLAAMTTWVIVLGTKNKFSQDELDTVKERCYIEGYIKGSYECLKSDSLILSFVKTYDVTPAEQGILVEILDMTRSMHQQVEMFYPDLADQLAKM